MLRNIVRLFVKTQPAQQVWNYKMHNLPIIGMFRLRYVSSVYVMNDWREN